jgi:hypothetical protein
MLQESDGTLYARAVALGMVAVAMLRVTPLAARRGSTGAVVTGDRPV